MNRMSLAFELDISEHQLGKYERGESRLPYAIYKKSERLLRPDAKLDGVKDHNQARYEPPPRLDDNETAQLRDVVRLVDELQDKLASLSYRLRSPPKNL